MVVTSIDLYVRREPLAQPTYVHQRGNVLPLRIRQRIGLRCEVVVEGGGVEDDGLLRDEGVIFGRAVGTAPIEKDGGPLHWKLEAIRSYYRKQAASAQAALDASDERMRELGAVLEQATAALADKEAQRLAAEDIDAPLRVRDGFGLVVALVACVGAPLVVLSVLRPDAFAQPVPVAIAVTVAGLFSLFQARSLLFVSNAHLTRDAAQPELWKVYAAELLLPIAAAAFVAVFAHREGVWVQTAATFAFLLLLFWVTGKLTLSALPRVAAAVTAAREHKRLHAEAQEARAKREGAVSALEMLRGQLQEQRAEVARFNHTADARVALFMSEFELARRYARLREEKLREQRAAAVASEPTVGVPDTLALSLSDGDGSAPATA